MLQRAAAALVRLLFVCSTWSWSCLLFLSRQLQPSRSACSHFDQYACICRTYLLSNILVLAIENRLRMLKIPVLNRLAT